MDCVTAPYCDVSIVLAVFSRLPEFWTRLIIRGWACASAGSPVPGQRGPSRRAGSASTRYTNSWRCSPTRRGGLRNRALLSLGYDLLARRSEITSLRSEDVSWRRDGTLEVILRRSKTDQLGRGRIAFTSSRSANLLDDWLEWRGANIEPLFCSIYRGVAINRPISGSAVKNIIKSSVHAAGYYQWIVKDFSPHSMRVGAAQELLRRGHDSVAIMRAGGWRTTTVLARYLEKAEHNVWQSE